MTKKAQRAIELPITRFVTAGNMMSINVLKNRARQRPHRHLGYRLK